MKTTKRVRTRCECDYCGKKNWSIGAMRKHELHCTKNPDRECRVCKMVEGTQKPIAELMALLPDIELPENIAGVKCCERADMDLIESSMKGLRDACENCPACIMAALRQKGIPVPLVESFDFTREMKSIWNDINEAKREDEGCYYY